MRRASVPVSITPLLINQLPIDRVGLTEFTFTRYLVPWLCDYQGKALFLDSDMLVIDDIAELFEYGDAAVSVVNHQGSLSFERPSVMLFDCEQCQALTPEYINDSKTVPQSFEWAETESHLPEAWNYLVGYSRDIEPKLLHYTQGIPLYKECRDAEYSQRWFSEKTAMENHVSWLEIMGKSVHARPVLSKLGC